MYNKIFYKYGKQKSHPTILWNWKVILKGILNIIFIIRKWNAIIVHIYNCLVDNAMMLIISSFLHIFLELERIKEVIQFNQPLSEGSHPSYPGAI